MEVEDVAAECQICINTLITINGTSPYVCLYRLLPNDIRVDEDVTCSADDELVLPFFQHELVRNRSIQAFQESLLQQRLIRAKAGRSRTEVTQGYRIGQLVDIYRRPLKKDLVGWRGPCPIIALTGEGLITVRWQGQYLDIPVRQVRPHIPLIVPRQKNAKLRGPPGAAPEPEAPAERQASWSGPWRAAALRHMTRSHS